MLHYNVRQAVALQSHPRIKFQLNFTSKTAHIGKQAHQIQVTDTNVLLGPVLRQGNIFQYDIP